MSEGGQVDGRVQRRQRSAARLYDAAIELLATRPYDEVTVEDICERAGVGRATYFRAFGTKAGLLREYNRRLAIDARRRLGESPPRNIREALEHVRQAIVAAWADPSPAHAGMLAEVLATMPSANPHAVHPELLQLVTELVRGGVADGEIRGDLPVDLAAELAVISLSVPIGYSMSHEGVDTDYLSRTLLGVWLDGAVPSK